VTTWETDMVAWQNPTTEQRCPLCGGSSLAVTGIQPGVLAGMLVDYREGSVKPGRWRT
jgi:hypothetical protein